MVREKGRCLVSIQKWELPLADVDCLGIDSRNALVGKGKESMTLFTHCPFIFICLIPYCICCTTKQNRRKPWFSSQNKKPRGKLTNLLEWSQILHGEDHWSQLYHSWGRTVSGQDLWQLTDSCNEKRAEVWHKAKSLKISLTCLVRVKPAGLVYGLAFNEISMKFSSLST